MYKNLRKIVTEEIVKIINDNFDYEAFEAQVSSSLSFMQDIQGSSNKIREQIGLSGTNSEVDNHLNKALNNINEAIQNYFKTLSPDVKKEVIERIGEVNIDN